MELKHILIVFSLIGIVGLYGLTLLWQPSLVALSDLQHYEGNTVIVEGLVLAYHSTKYGNQIIEIRDVNNTSNGYKTTIFCETETLVEYGDIIQASGTVQKYEGDWEIIIDNERSINIITKWTNISFPLWQLAEHPDRYTGININITGIVERTYDTYFYLTDDEGTYTLLVSPRPQHISPGESLSLHGVFTYDTSNLRYFLQLTEELYTDPIEE